MLKGGIVYLCKDEQRIHPIKLSGNERSFTRVLLHEKRATQGDLIRANHLLVIQAIRQRTKSEVSAHTEYTSSQSDKRTV